MALRHIPRRRAPIDGTLFRTEACLRSLLNSATRRYPDSIAWPEFTGSTWVPIWVRMEQYKAQETRQNPSGMIYGPVVRIGSKDSPEIELFGSHYAANLETDCTLDWKDSERPDRWIYKPLPEDADAPGEDVSIYICDKCQQTLYRDETGRAESRSACISDGALVCRDCDVTGLVYDAATEAQIERCRRLADYLDREFMRGYREQFERNIEWLARDSYFGSPAQTRLYREDQFSFGFGITAFTTEGKKRGMNGGLIQRGPHPIEGEGGFTFRIWDYGTGVERDATRGEVGNISWSIHT